MKLICPECKNDVDLSQHPDLAKDQSVECNVCGISLLVTAVEGGQVSAEIMDEGK
jgi:ribosomal protein S27E